MGTSYDVNLLVNSVMCSSEDRACLIEFQQSWKQSFSIYINRFCEGAVYR